ncbi:unnamed protein product [Rotaria socialis]
MLQAGGEALARQIHELCNKAWYEDRLFENILHHFGKTSQQRNLSTMKTKRSTILHYWNNGHRSPATIARITKMDSATSTQMNGLQKYFALWNTNVNTEAQRSTCSMGNST